VITTAHPEAATAEHALIAVQPPQGDQVEEILADLREEAWEDRRAEVLVDLPEVERQVEVLAHHIISVIIIAILLQIEACLVMRIPEY
jgi:hypothetical protein